MFSFLIFIGIISISFGIYLSRNELNSYLALKERVDNKQEKLDEIINRIEAIEEDLKRSYVEEEIDFIDILDLAKMDKEEDMDFLDMDLDMEKEAKSGEEGLEIGEDMVEAFKTISLLEQGKYSLDQVCKILNMKKGEVLLLRNLYKKYQG